MKKLTVFALVIVLGLMFLVGCGELYEGTIVGIWDSVSSSRVVWSFYDNGVCKYSTRSTSMSGTYSIHDSTLKTVLINTNTYDARPHNTTVTTTYRILELSYLDLAIQNTKSKGVSKWQRSTR